MKLIEQWDIFSTLSNIFQILGTIILIFSSPSNSNNNNLMGLGCMCAWIEVARLLEYNNKSNNLFSTTLARSFAQILRYTIQAIPLFLAFSYLGIIMFNKYSKWKNANESIKSLFSLMCGDMLSDTILDVLNEGNLGFLYLLIYIITFMYITHNIYISIICYGYEKQRFQRHTKRNNKNEAFEQKRDINFEKPH